MVGKLLDRRYEIVEVLAISEMSHTYLAQDTKMPSRPRCVVKQLKPANSSFFAKAKCLFEKEAEILYNLGSHAQIPKLLASFDEDQEFYLVQEFIEGYPLTHEISPGLCLSESQVWQLLEEVLTILVFVHGKGVIHRDIKPANIMRRKHDQKLVLIDFGAIKLVHLPELNIQSQVQSTTAPDYAPTLGSSKAAYYNTQVERTKTIILGTEGYIPSEQFKGKPIFRSDLYALGIVCIQALTGLRPTEFQEDSEGEILWQHQSQASKELKAFLTKMVRSHFKERYQSAEAALEVLRQFLNLSQAPLETVISDTPQSQKDNWSNKSKNKKLLWLIAGGTSISLATIGTTMAVSAGLNYQESEKLIKIAENAQTQRNWADCIKYSTNVLQNSKFFRDKAQNYSDDCRFTYAQNLAKKGRYNSAIKEANQITQNSEDYNNASNYIYEWSKEILKIALNEYHQGNLESAVKIAQEIPSIKTTKTIIQDAQKLTQDWKEESQKNERLLQEANQAINSEKLSNAESLIKQVTIMGNPIEPTTGFYQQQIQPLINDLKKTREIVAIKAAEYERKKEEVKASINEWLEVKKYIYGAYRNSERAKEYAKKFTTGERYQKVVDYIDELDQKYAYWEYGKQNIDNVSSFYVNGNQATITVTIIEEVVYYENEERDENKPETQKTTNTYTLVYLEGRWKQQ